jgi:hypothetical protein
LINVRTLKKDLHDKFGELVPVAEQQDVIAEMRQLRALGRSLRVVSGMMGERGFDVLDAAVKGNEVLTFC